MLVNVVFFADPGTSFLNIVIIYFIKGRQVKERIEYTSQSLNKMGRSNIDPRRESLAVSIRKFQDENTIAMYGLSKWFTIIFPQFCFQYSKKYCFVTLRIFSLFYDGWLDIRELANQLDRRDVLLKRECQPDETMNSMWWN